MSNYTPTTRVYGHGCITLTHYPSSGRLGVVQVGTNAVMDSWELVEFAREAGLLTERDRQVAERAWAEGYVASASYAEFGDAWDGPPECPYTKGEQK